MNREDRIFINEMIKELDESIRNLAAEEGRLIAKLGEARVAELLEYWQKRMPPDELDAFKLALDHDDKKLTWIWFRLQRARQARAKAGQALMRGGT